MMKKILFFVSFFFGLSFSISSLFTGKTMLDYAVEMMPKVTIKPVSITSRWDSQTYQVIVTFVYSDEAKQKATFSSALSDGEKYYFPLSSGNWIVIFDNHLGDEQFISFETQTVHKVEEKNLKPVGFEYIMANKAKLRWKDTNNLLELIIN
ncbi:MAG: hypothetical protein PHE89_04875 [Alphaproteobacteria bacterium]|nr:hypothetical protein [Alphaproteobacteria bacterium]